MSLLIATKARRDDAKWYLYYGMSFNIIVDVILTPGWVRAYSKQSPFVWLSPHQWYNRHTESAVCFQMADAESKLFFELPPPARSARAQRRDYPEPPSLVSPNTRRRILEEEFFEEGSYDVVIFRTTSGGNFLRKRHLNNNHQILSKVSLHNKQCHVCIEVVKIQEIERIFCNSCWGLGTF